MLEKGILINELGEPIMETRTNSHTVVRRALNEEERAAFDAQQKDALSAGADEKIGGAPEAPPVVSLPAADVPKPTPKVKAKKKPTGRPVGKPVD